MKDGDNLIEKLQWQRKKADRAYLLLLFTLPEHEIILRIERN